LVEHSLGKGEVTSSILVIGSRDKRGADMYHIWSALWWAWSAAVVVYFVLLVVTVRRLRASKEKRSVDVMFWLVVVLVWIRILARLALHRGPIYQVAVVLAGIASGVATLVLIRALIKQKPNEGSSEV
jgi:hypothetical protein